MKSRTISRTLALAALLCCAAAGCKKGSQNDAVPSFSRSQFVGTWGSISDGSPYLEGGAYYGGTSWQNLSASYGAIRFALNADSTATVTQFSLSGAVMPGYPKAGKWSYRPEINDLKILTDDYGVLSVSATTEQGAPATMLRLYLPAGSISYVYSWLRYTLASPSPR